MPSSYGGTPRARSGLARPRRIMKVSMCMRDGADY